VRSASVALKRELPLAKPMGKRDADQCDGHSNFPAANF
jgi:hypothetical protein